MSIKPATAMPSVAYAEKCLFQFEEACGRNDLDAVRDIIEAIRTDGFDELADRLRDAFATGLLYMLKQAPQ